MLVCYVWESYFSSLSLFSHLWAGDNITTWDNNVTQGRAQCLACAHYCCLSDSGLGLCLLCPASITGLVPHHSPLRALASSHGKGPGTYRALSGHRAPARLIKLRWPFHFWTACNFIFQISFVTQEWIRIYLEFPCIFSLCSYGVFNYVQRICLYDCLFPFSLFPIYSQAHFL